MQAEKKERVDKSMNKGNMKCNLDNGICTADCVTKRQVDMIPGPLVLFAFKLSQKYNIFLQHTNREILRKTI